VCPRAKKIKIVMDNLNTHEPGSFYEAFPPDKAKALWERFEFVYTEFVRKEVLAWEKSKNNKNAKVKWQFTTEDARIKLTRLYP
jgi:hypothetical protein